MTNHPNRSTNYRASISSPNYPRDDFRFKFDDVTHTDVADALRSALVRNCPRAARAVIGRQGSSGGTVRYSFMVAASSGAVLARGTVYVDPK